MKDLAQKTEETLRSLDSIQRAEASPWLYAKIMNQIGKPVEQISARLAWQMIVALAVVVVMNLLTIRHFYSPAPVSGNKAELVANEYAISLPQTY